MSLNWPAVPKPSEAPPEELVQIGTSAFLPPVILSNSTPLFSLAVSPKEELPESTSEPTNEFPSKPSSQPRARLSIYGSLRRLPSPVLKRASFSASSSPSTQPISTELHRIENLQSLRCSFQLARQDSSASAGLQVDPRTVGSKIKALSDCFLRLQQCPEKLLSFFSSYQLYTDTDALLCSLLAFTDQALVLSRQQDIVYKGEASQIADYFDSMLFLRFLPVLLTTWISFDDRLVPFFPRILDFFTQRLAADSSHSSIQGLPDLLSTCMEPHAALPSAPEGGRKSPTHDASAETESFTDRFFSLSPQEAASCLNRSHLRLLRQVRPWTLIDYALHPSASSSEDSPCAAIPAHFNSIVGWVSLTCLKPSTPKKRADVVTCWVQIARACWESGYVSILLMITSTLNSTPISRLKQTWAMVDGPTAREFNAFTDFCSPLGNYAPLREFVAKHQGVVMPMAITTRDLIMMAEMLDLKGALSAPNSIPYEICLTFGNLLTTPPIYHLLQEDSDPESASMAQFLVNPMPRFTPDRLYGISILREPSEFRITEDEDNF